MKHAHLKFLNLFCYAFVVFIFTFSTSYSAPYLGTRTALEQPDGSIVEALMFGDEFYGWFETPDGYTIIKDPKTGWFCYAILTKDESLKSSSIKYRGHEVKNDNELLQKMNDAEIHKKLKPSTKKQRELRYAKMKELNTGRDGKAISPTNSNGIPLRNLPASSPDDIQQERIGNFLGITILVDFSDDVATMPISAIDSLLNVESGYTRFGNNGSVREYFSDISGGLVDYTNSIPAYYYRAKYPKTYYMDTTIAYGTRGRELVTEALRYVDSIGFDFSTLSHDTNDLIYSINVFYAGGNGGKWSKGLWPHSGYLWPVFNADGVSSNYYQITNIGNSPFIGTFCHENGHMLLDYPDLYDYGFESMGTGSYCLMSSSGGINPVPPCPYLRDLSGWVTIKDLTFLPNDGRLLTQPANINSVYRYINAEETPAQEYFLIENIRSEDRYSSLADEGLAIWHVDRFGYNGYEQMTCDQHYLVSIEQADGRFDLEIDSNSQDAGDLFDATDNEFSDVTTPDANWWCNTTDLNTDSHLRIYDISASGDTMTFRCSGASDMTVTHPTTIPVSSVAQVIQITTPHEGQVVNLNGEGIDEQLLTDPHGEANFSVIADTPDDTIWVTVTGQGFRYRGYIVVISSTHIDTTDLVMGFENANLWHFIYGTSGTLTDNSYNTTEGDNSMQVGGNNWQQFQSVNLNTDDINATSSNLKVDIFVGNTQPNPWWIGQVQLYVNCPSAGINNQAIGSAELTGLTRGMFSTVSFNLPANVTNVLNGSHNDFSFSFSLNTNWGSGPYFFDNMRF
ncbi:MAG TPA: M6 family metalloprotease domain-containing protein [Chitinispirillaceae bacterium]|nr:M6 family metalloprotease domain-containing protein [Chitinispirillaceae bacterium]